MAHRDFDWLSRIPKDPLELQAFKDETASLLKRAEAYVEGGRLKRSFRLDGQTILLATPINGSKKDDIAVASANSSKEASTSSGAATEETPINTSKISKPASRKKQKKTPGSLHIKKRERTDDATAQPPSKRVCPPNTHDEVSQEENNEVFTPSVIPLAFAGQSCCKGYGRGCTIHSHRRGAIEVACSDACSWECECVDRTESQIIVFALV